MGGLQENTKITKKRQVSQANPLARSAQQMDIHEKRLVLYAIAQIRWDQDKFQPVEISVNDLKQIMGSSNKNIYRIAADAARGLLKRTIFMGSDNEDDPWTEFQWVSRSTYIPAKKHNSNQSTIILEFHEGLTPYLLQLRENYNSIPLLELLTIPSFNSLRLFEILYHDSHRGQKTFLTYDIEDLKKRIGLEDKYPKFKDFRYVLDRAKKDLEDHTSLYFDYEGTGSGRTYTQIRFKVKPNSNYQAPPGLESQNQTQTDTELTSQEIRLITLLNESGYSQNASETIKTYGLKRVETNLNLAKKKAREAAATQKPIMNLGGLIAYMIKHDVADAEAKQSQIEAETQTLERMTDLLESSYLQAYSAGLHKYWEDLLKTEKDAVHDIIRVSAHSSLLKVLDQSSWSGRAYEAERNRVLLNEYEDALPLNLRSVSVFVKHEGLLGEFTQEQQDQMIKTVENRLL